MKKYDKKIEDISECPNCGDNFGYYTKLYAYGWIQDCRLFETRKPYNSEMWDSLMESRQSKYYFCLKCNKKIARVEN